MSSESVAISQPGTTGGSVMPKPSDSLAQAYAELGVAFPGAVPSSVKKEEKAQEKPVSEQKPAEGTPKAEEKPPEQKAEEKKNEKPPEGQPAKLDFKAIRQQIAEGKEPDEATLTALQALGIDKAFLSEVREAFQARSELVDNQVYSVAGGKEAYERVASWARQNLSAPAQQAYNDAVFSGDKTKLDLAVRGLVSAYEAANGKTGDRLSGKGGANAGIKPFESRADVLEAMSNPRWKSDPVYQQQVMERLKVSPGPNILGI